MNRLTYILIALALPFFACVGVLPRFPEVGLDHSWQQALCDATDKGRVFGKDVVFTYGPLHQVATNQVSNNLTPFVLGRIVFGISWFCMGLLFCIIFGTTSGCILLFGIVIINARTGWPEGQPDLMIFLLAMLYLIIGFYTLTSKCPSFCFRFILLLLSGVGVVLSPLVKLSFLTSTIPSFLGVLAISLIGLISEKTFRSSIKTFSLAFIPLVVLIFVWDFTTKSGFNGLVGYFTGPNWDIVKGYANAMSTSPSYGSSALQIVLYFFSYFSLGLIFLGKDSKSLAIFYHENRPRFFSAFVVVLVFLALSWVFFKVGFVRHDVQAITPGLVLVGLWFVVIALRWKRISRIINGKYAAFILPGLVSPILIGFMIAIANGYLPSVKKGSFEYLFELPKTLHSTFSTNGLESLKNSRQKALMQISNENEPFHISDDSNSTVDILPWDITNVLANGLFYRPRPVPQSYSAYTKSLQIANLRHFQNPESRPEYVIVQIGEIDDRLPIGLDSKSLRFIFSNYSLVKQKSNNALIFCLAQSPTKEVIKDTFVGSLFWHRVGNLLYHSSLIPINCKDSYVWITSEFKPAFLNTFATLVFKPFPTFIEYLDDDCSVVFSARIIPSAVNSMLIYPLILKNDDFFKLPNMKIKYIRFASRFFQQPFLRSEYVLEYTEPPLFKFSGGIYDAK